MTEIQNPWETWKEQNMHKCPIWDMHKWFGRTPGKKCSHCTFHYKVDKAIPGEFESKQIRGRTVKVQKYESIPHCQMYPRQDVSWPSQWDACGLFEANKKESRGKKP